VAKELGVSAISVASTGNMAASCSCYAAAAGMPCFVFVPEDTPASKLSQSIAFGGKIVQVKGSYDDAARLAEQVAVELGFYLAGDYAFRVEGQKTAAFELVDQLFFDPPELIFIPMGCGTNITGYQKGFDEYKALGFIDRLPRLIGTQAAGAKSIVDAYDKRARDVTPLKTLNTIASAISVKKPLDGTKALDAIYRSEGMALAVTDEEILRAQYELSRGEGIYVEASCATTIAALKKLVDIEGAPRGRVVCVLTGDGLKDPSAILKIALKPPTIYPEVREFQRLYEGGRFARSAVAFVKREEILFSSLPSTDAIQEVITRYLPTINTRTTDDRESQKNCDKLSFEELTSFQRAIGRFLKKGKHVSFADLQDILQGVFASSEETIPALVVEDFEVRTSLDAPPSARVIVRIGNHIFEASDTGVGPVDAVINALRKACGNAVSFSLDNFNVAIRSQGTDAVVVVEMKLSREGNFSSAVGTSPDVIQASIEAFQAAYNGLPK
jgi:threonine synthase